MILSLLRVKLQLWITLRFFFGTLVCLSFIQNKELNKFYKYTYKKLKFLFRNTNTWEKSDELPGHQLTITQMAFSPDDKYLLSVSRDRKWCLFEKQG